MHRKNNLLLAALGAALALGAILNQTNSAEPPKTAAAKPAAQPAKPAAAGAQSPSPIDKTFLTASDLGPRYKLTEEHYGNLGDQPKAFAKFKGQHSGIKVFQGPLDSPIQRVVDIRWVFPDAKLAQSFLDGSPEIAEGQPPWKDFKPVGSSCRVHGGLNMVALRRKAGVMHHYYYIFREGRCVVKLYVSEGMLSKDHPTTASIYPIAQKADERCKGF